MKTYRAILYLTLVLTIALASCNLPSGNATPTPSPVVSTGTGIIRGTIWHDLCAYSGGAIPNPLPAGCIPNGLGGATGNGVRDAGETGIPGVQVALHKDDCTSAPVSTSATDGNGDYSFNGLMDGAYCITVDANTSPNNNVLMPGTWSHPTSQTLVVQLADKLISPNPLTLDFGWDYQNQPASTLPTSIVATQVPPTSSTSAFFIVDTPANCRSGPGTVYTVVTSYPVGQTLTLSGRNNDNSWWYAPVSSSQNCWISNVVGHTTGNTGILPIIAAPPTPIPPTNTPAGDTTAPTLSDALAVNTDLYYPNTTCGSTDMLMAIRASDSGSGLDSIWLKYRYKGSGSYVGNWHTVSPNDSASGGQQGFNYSIIADATSELGTDNGSLEYQFFARDKSGNIASYPSGSTLTIPIHYCP